jgi:ribosomal protein L37AE/L43A
MAPAHNPKQSVDTLREKLETDQRGGCDADREALIAFSNRLKLLRETYSWFRHVKLLRHCVRMSEHVDVRLVDCLDDRDATEQVIYWIHDEYDLNETPETNQNYRVALRMFGKRSGERDEIPPSIDWVTTTLPSSYDPMPDPNGMLRWDEEIQAMLDAARNPRDEAAIALQFDAGLRGGELETLTIGDLTDNETGLVVSVDGKTGQRAVDLVPSVPYVNQWLNKHPGGNDTDPLWSKLSRVDDLSYRGYLDMFAEPAKRAEISKSVTPTNFRKSNACWLARQGASQTLIEDRQGRKRGSKATARYIARFGRESANRQYRKLHGLEVEETEEEDIAPVKCPRCDRKTPREEPMCVWCGQATSPEAANEARKQDRALFESASQADDDLLDDLRDLRDTLDENPELRRFLAKE